MTRFSCLAYFMLSSTLFDESIMDVSMLHDVDDSSDHDLNFLYLRINVMPMALSDRVYTQRLSWAEAGTNERANHTLILSQTLRAIQPPANSLLCTYKCFKYSDHHSEIAHYAEIITSACISAAE
jgi:hypothetical protein